MPNWCEKVSASASCSPSRSHNIYDWWVYANGFFQSYNDRVFSVENKFRQSWKAGTPCPNVKSVYRVVESSDSIDSYYGYLFVLHINYQNILSLSLVSGKHTVMSASATTEQIATAGLEMMVIPCYAHPHFAVPARLSKHHSKSALPIPVERKYTSLMAFICALHLHLNLSKVRKGYLHFICIE